MRKLFLTQPTQWFPTHSRHKERRETKTQSHLLQISNKQRRKLRGYAYQQRQDNKKIKNKKVVGVDKETKVSFHIPTLPVLTPL